MFQIKKSDYLLGFIDKIYVNLHCKLIVNKLFQNIILLSLTFGNNKKKGKVDF